MKFNPTTESNGIEQKPKSPEGNDFDAAFEKILHQSPIIGSGKDGIVLKIDVTQIDPETLSTLKEKGLDLSSDAAAKILKIYRPGEAKREFDFHQRAYYLLSKAGQDVAQVPRPILIMAQHLAQSDIEFLNKAGAKLDDEAEILLMDYVDGQDVASMIYVFAMQELGYDDLMIKSLSIEEHHKIVGDRLGFDTPEEENPYVENVISIENTNKLMTFLQKRGFKIDPTTIQKWQNSIKILEQNGIFHNDLSERNVMIGKDGQPYIIDFGRSTDNKEDHLYDDSAFIKRLKKINSGANEGTMRKNMEDQSSWARIANTIDKNPRWTKVIPRWRESLDNADLKMIESTLLSMIADESSLDQALATLVHIVQTSSDKDRTRELIVALITNLIDKSKANIFGRDKLSRYKEFMSSL